MVFKWSDIGSYNESRMKDNEDVVISRKEGKNSVVALCDGVSTCENSGKGAGIACESLSSFFLKKGVKLIKYNDRVIAEKTIAHILYDLEKKGVGDDTSLESLSSTAACVFYDETLQTLLCINVGDSLIGGFGINGFEVILKPQEGYNGCYVTTTFGVEKVTQVAKVDANRFRSVFICSDGMWKQLYSDKSTFEKAKNALSSGNFDSFVIAVKDKKTLDDRSIILLDYHA